MPPSRLLKMIVLSSCSLISLSSSALNIHINPLSSLGLPANAPALAAFERAASRWESHITDPVSVNIDADLRNLGSSTIIGQASSVLLGASHDFMRSLVTSDAAGEVDDAIVAALPTASQFSLSLPAGFTQSGFLIGTKANIKALGISGLDGLFGSNDATIEFNSGFGFDFDNSNGITAGEMDFETVAAHEIGHALGFISQVDRIDFLLNQAGDPNSITGVSPTLLDLFRFSGSNPALNPSTPAEFTSLPREMRPGEEAVFDDLDTEYALATGAFVGDGDQASHWKDDNNNPLLHIGIMDPTLATGQSFDITQADLRALDLIGYDIAAVPLPGGMILLLSGLGLLGLVGGKRVRHRGPLLQYNPD